MLNLLRRLSLIAAALAMAIMLAAAITMPPLPHPPASFVQPIARHCHTASCRAAFAPESLSAGYIDPALALRAQFGNKVFSSQ